jgi:hypothetical protein
MIFPFYFIYIYKLEWALSPNSYQIFPISPSTQPYTLFLSFFKKQTNKIANKQEYVFLKESS